MNECWYNNKNNLLINMNGINIKIIFNNDIFFCFFCEVVSFCARLFWSADNAQGEVS
jgi:hypothetical protein